LHNSNEKETNNEKSTLETRENNDADSVSSSNNTEERQNISNVTNSSGFMQNCHFSDNTGTNGFNMNVDNAAVCMIGSGVETRTYEVDIAETNNKRNTEETSLGEIKECSSIEENDISDSS